MVKALYLYISDDMTDEILNEIHDIAISDDSSFVLKENDDFKNESIFEKAIEKDFGDGVVIRYTEFKHHSPGELPTMDPLGLYTHILVIKEA